MLIKARQSALYQIASGERESKKKNCDHSPFVPQYKPLFLMTQEKVEPEFFYRKKITNLSDKFGHNILSS